MFGRIKAAFTHKSHHDQDWSNLCDAGYKDAPRYASRNHANESAKRERIVLQTMGHLR